MPSMQEADRPRRQDDIQDRDARRDALLRVLNKVPVGLLQVRSNANISGRL